jgi:alkanesulfonate monooxygenase SsuD/methylene tetrahydromethanopterin reductase-like flavin-dependent oxidoreductase (luciferase family)
MSMLARLALASASAAVLALGASHALAQNGAPYVLVETGESFNRLQDAVDAAGDRTATIRFANGRFADCAVQTAGAITYLAATAGQSVLEGACEDKAALVLRGRAARVEGLVFANIKVPDFNGAGIRLEKGNLAVSQSWFRDSQQGDNHRQVDLHPAGYLRRPGRLRPFDLHRRLWQPCGYPQPL